MGDASMTVLVIGASISNRIDASQQVAGLFQELEFPCDLEIKNLTFRDLVIPELGCFEIKAYQKKQVTFNDIGLLKRVVSSMAQIARLNSFSQIAHIGSNVDEIDTGVDMEKAQLAEPATEPRSYGDVTVLQELDGGFLQVQVDGLTFEIRKTQLREDGSLTAGGVTAYEAAKNIQNN